VNSTTDEPEEEYGEWLGKSEGFMLITFYPGGKRIVSVYQLEEVVASENLQLAGSKDWNPAGLFHGAGYESYFELEWSFTAVFYCNEVASAGEAVSPGKDA